MQEATARFFEVRGGVMRVLFVHPGPLMYSEVYLRLEPLGMERVGGSVTAKARGPVPVLLESLDKFPPARDLLARRKNYFIGMLDPCASIEFTRGCPWDCSFCSAWTFYGRSYRMASAEAAG